MTLGFALVSALLFLAWLTDRRSLLWPAFVLSLGFASGLSLSGHSAVDAGSSWLSELADWAHLAAASLWVGGLVQLAFVVWPLAPELRRDAFLRFSKLATVLIVRAARRRDLPERAAAAAPGRPLDERYGQVLLVKLALVSLALLWGAAHHFLVRPALERGAPPFARPAAEPDRRERGRDGDPARRRRAGRVEAAAAAGRGRQLAQQGR